MFYKNVTDIEQLSLISACLYKKNFVAVRLVKHQMHGLAVSYCTWSISQSQRLPSTSKSHNALNELSRSESSACKCWSRSSADIVMPMFGTGAKIIPLQLKRNYTAAQPKFLERTIQIES